MPANTRYGLGWGVPVPAPGPVLSTDLDVGSVRVTKRSASTRRPELVLSRGPLVYGQPGQSWNDLLGSRYALALLKSGALALYQLRDTWQPIEYEYSFNGSEDALLPIVLPVLPAGAKHLGFCFDQSGHPVMCWESGGAAYVRQYDPALGVYVIRGPFVGHDPVLSFDALHSGQIPGSDVVLFVLSADRTRLDSRLQRDLYRVVYPVAVFETPALLDQAVSLPYRLQLLGEVGGAELALLSAYDPLNVEDALSLGASGPLAGQYPLVVQTRTEQDPVSLAASGPLGGQYLLVTLTPPGVLDALSLAASGPQAGQYTAVTLARELYDELTLNASGPSAGEYTT